MADITILPKTKQELQEEWLKCALDFEYFAETYLKTEDKRIGGLVPFKLMPHQNRLIKLYNNHDKVITNKYRQSGITSVTCAYAAWSICFQKNIKAIVVGNTLGHARTELLKRIDEFIENLPEFLKIEKKKDSENHKIYHGGSEIQAVACSSQGLRGKSMNFLILDELAWYDFGDSFIMAAQSSWSTGGRVFGISTPNGVNNIFYKMFEGALQGTNQFVGNELKWYHDIRLNENLKWINGNEIIVEDDHEQQKILIKKGFKPTSPWFEKECGGFGFDKKKIAQELEGEFLGSGSSYIDEEMINFQEVEYVTKPLYYEHTDKNFWIWKFPDSVDQKFIFGVDVSSGVAEDYSTICVIDMFTREMYAEYRGKIMPDLFADIIYKFANIYNQAYVAIDLTGGYGGTTAQKLINNYDYKNLHYSEVKDRYIKDKLEEEGKGDLRPGITIGKNNRWEILDSMSRAFRENNLIIRSSRLTEELKGFKDVNGRPDHKRGGTSDSIFALAIALYVGETNGTSISKSLERTKSMVSAWTVANYNNEDFAREQYKFEENIKNNENFNKIPSLFYFY